MAHADAAPPAIDLAMRPDDIGFESERALAFVKGHGTQNDFVVLHDPHAEWNLTPEFVAALCDRRRGLGADGVLRVARADALCVTGVLGILPAGVRARDWFMDYRNADGSVAEMCGNGVRVFAHHLVASGAVESADFVVGTRAGARPVHVHHADATYADVTVQMGPVTVGEWSTAQVGPWAVSGLTIDVGNPHLACIVPCSSPEEVAAMDLSHPVIFDRSAFPHGVNLEIVTPLTDGSVSMRVIERGVGETRSCGTGTVAAAAAALAASLGNAQGRVDVHVPGGTVTVQIGADGATLRGPSVLVGSGSLRPGWDVDVPALHRVAA